MNNKNDAQCELVREIGIICDKMRKNEQLFDLAESDELIEAVIYEQKALQARYSFLLRTARECGIVCDFAEIF